MKKEPNKQKRKVNNKKITNEDNFLKQIGNLPKKIVIYKQIDPPKENYLTFKLLWNGEIQRERTSEKKFK